MWVPNSCYMLSQLIAYSQSALVSEYMCGIFLSKRGNHHQSIDEIVLDCYLENKTKIIEIRHKVGVTIN